jgi:hypothetical protein
MTCQECELALASEENCDGHLAECAACREFALELRANSDAMRALGVETMPVVRPRLVRWPGVVAAAGVAVAAMIAVVVMMPRKPVPITIAKSVVEPVVSMAQETVPVKRHVRKRIVKNGEPQLLQVKMLTDDPNVVIYWQIESKKGTE